MTPTLSPREFLNLLADGDEDLETLAGTLDQAPAIPPSPVRTLASPTPSNGKHRGWDDFMPDGEGFIAGRSATFADAKDLRRYAAAAAAGKSEMDRLRVGDNGRGAFGDITAGPRPFVAIPRDVLAQAYGDHRLAKGRSVEVIAPNGERTVIPIGDIGPRVMNRHNNAVIEFNPAALAALKLKGDTDGVRYRFL